MIAAWRNRRIYSYILLVILLALSSCDAPPAANNDQPAPPRTSAADKHGTRLIVQYVPKKDQTNVFQQDFVIKPEVFVGKDPAKGKHTFEINNMASFKGETPIGAPEKSTLLLTHLVADKNYWHFPDKAKAAIVIDNERIEIPVNNQTELDKETETDEEFYETVMLEVSLENHLKIARAQSVEFHIGDGKFNLSSENIQAFKGFSDYLIPKTGTP